MLAVHEEESSRTDPSSPFDWAEHAFRIREKKVFDNQVKGQTQNLERWYSCYSIRDQRAKAGFFVMKISHTSPCIQNMCTDFP